jgi:hypothetical protein
LRSCPDVRIELPITVAVFIGPIDMSGMGLERVVDYIDPRLDDSLRELEARIRQEDSRA